MVPDRYANPYESAAIKTKARDDLLHPRRLQKRKALHQAHCAPLISHPPLEAGCLPNLTFCSHECILALLPLEFTVPTSPDMTHAGHVATPFHLDIIQRHKTERLCTNPMPTAAKRNVLSVRSVHPPAPSVSLPKNKYEAKLEAR